MFEINIFIQAEEKLARGRYEQMHGCVSEKPKGVDGGIFFTLSSLEASQPASGFPKYHCCGCLHFEKKVLGRIAQNEDPPA